jgi:hypothetical protein
MEPVSEKTGKLDIAAPWLTANTELVGKDRSGASKLADERFDIRLFGRKIEKLAEADNRWSVCGLLVPRNRVLGAVEELSQLHLTKPPPPADRFHSPCNLLGG